MLNVGAQLSTVNLGLAKALGTTAKATQELEYYLGIDLGTSTTLAAFMTQNHRQPEFVAVRWHINSLGP